MKRGDILFYKAFHGNVLDAAIDVFEQNPRGYVHCAIAISKTEKVEAVLSGGIVKSGIGRVADSVYSLPENCAVDRIYTAFTWLDSQVGHAYGCIDIVDAILASFERDVLLPDSNYDCSALCAEFLTLIGIDLGALSHNVHTVTPEELADKLGVN